MCNIDNRESEATNQNSSRDFEQEYLDTKLKLNKRTLRGNSKTNNHQQELDSDERYEQN